MRDQELTRSVWDVDGAAFPSGRPVEEQARFLLRYAILAPSSHNSQPWRFRITGGVVEVLPDEERWLASADPDRRELFLSVGCAVANLRVAARRFGFTPHVDYDTGDDDLAAVVTLLGGEEPSGRTLELFEAVTERYTSHAPFEDRPVGPAARERVEAAVEGVELRFVGGATKDDLAALQAEADRRLMDDPDYRRELGHWVGIGALGGSWLAARVGQAVLTHVDLGDREAAKSSTLLDSAPLVAVLATEGDGPVERVRAGQAFERAALAAAAEGLAVHPMSQTLERPDTRERLREVVGCEGRPQHLFRLGYADEQPDHTPRWPVEAFIEE